MLAGELAKQVPLIDKVVSTFCVEDHVRGAGIVDSLVDTGAGYTAINGITPYKLKAKALAVYVRNPSAMTADAKESVVSVYRISSFGTGGECELHHVEVMVLPGSTHCILGWGTLKRVAPFLVSLEPTPGKSLSHCRKAVAKLGRQHPVASSRGAAARPASRRDRPLNPPSEAPGIPRGSGWSPA